MSDKTPNCPFCSIEMKPNEDKNYPHKCPKCEREWGYIGQGNERSLMSKRKRVSVDFNKLHEGANINDVIKPIAPPAIDHKTRSTGEDLDD